MNDFIKAEIAVTVMGTKRSAILDAGERFEMNLGDVNSFVVENELYCSQHNIITFLEERAHDRGDVLFSVHFSVNGVSEGYNLIDVFRTWFSERALVDYSDCLSLVNERMMEYPSLFNMDPSDIIDNLILPASV